MAPSYSNLRELALQQQDDGRKRVAKACDRCRLKKVKCDGKVPCTRCQSENAVCRFGERKKSIERRIPPGYVEYLEEQQRILVKALKKTWMQYAAPGSRLYGLTDPPVHSIMEDLGVLAELASHNPDREDFHFEEDLEKLRQQCELEAETNEHLKLSRSSSSCSSIDAPALHHSISFDNSWMQPTPAAKQMKMAHQRLVAPQIMRTNSTPHCWEPQSVDSQTNTFARPRQFQQQPQQQMHSNLHIMTSSVPQSMMDWSFTADLTTPTNPTMPQTPLTPMNPTWTNMQTPMYNFTSNTNDYSGLDEEWKTWVPSRAVSVCHPYSMMSVN